MTSLSRVRVATLVLAGCLCRSLVSRRRSPFLRTSWTQLSASRKGPLRPVKKRRTSKGPRKLKSGYWQEGDEEDEIDVFEWISAEDLEDEPAAAVSTPDEVSAYSNHDGFDPREYAAPEYRAPSISLQLNKGIKSPPPLDQSWPERSFIADVEKALSCSGRELASFGHVDVVTSLSCLKMLLAFVDGSLTDDMRAKGLNTRRRHEPELVDLMRILRLPEASHTIYLATVWNWVPANTTTGVGALNRMSYDVAMERAATGQEQLVGPPSARLRSEPLHHRLLEYECGGLRMLVRVPVVAAMPAVDLEGVEGHAVDIRSVNRRDAADLWGSSLASRYAEMQLSDTGMLVRGIVDKGTLIELQELTREDLRLDRPSVAADADCLLGKLVGLLRRVQAVADCPGCKDRPLYLQYSDAELRVIAPIFDAGDEPTELSDKVIEDLLSMSS